MSGCAPKDPLPLGRSYKSSKINVPFIAPRTDLCGATSIKMVSSYWQSRTSYVPNLSLHELDESTLIPDKGGTLQVELIASARANGLIAYPLEPSFDALFSELSENHPVIVLVNRSFSWYPLWHYAPITGYDAKERNILMHFSDRANEALPIATFGALWDRSERWGIILLPPGELPVSVSPKKFLISVYDFEKIGMRKEAIVAYQSALMRWNDNKDILFALANAYYLLGNIDKAEQNYRKLLSLEPVNPLVLNNLSDLLYHTQRLAEALRLINQAVTNDIEIQSIIKATKKEITEQCIELNIPIK
jgi:tetratricopeptide (TPR) repeat protein